MALGVATDPGGQVLDGHGRGHRLWTLGALRRGELWETTAVPEIRVQARDLALALAGTAPSPAGAGRAPVR